MRRCPACKSRLPLLTVTDPTRLLRLLCPRCWGTVRLNPEQFLLYSTAGFVVGMLVVGLLIAQSWSWQTFFEAGFSCGCLIGWIGGRFFPRLEIEDLPLVGGVTLRPAKGGDLSVFFTHQISLALLIIAVLLVITPILLRRRQRRAEAERPV